MLTVLLAALLTGVDDPQSDLERMQGTWVLVSTADGPPGRKRVEPTDRTFKLVIKGKTSKGTQGEKSGEEGAFTLDPTKTPKQIDTFHPIAGHLKGIYELEGDTMRYCSSPPGEDRPTSFATTPTTIAGYRREKSGQ